MIERLRKYIYNRRARKCAERGHEWIIVERAGRRDGLYVIEQRVQCQRCQTALSEWYIVLSEDKVEVLWKRAS